MATSLDQLGYAALSRGDPPEAEAYFDNSLGLYQAEEDRAGMGRSLAGLASVAVASGRWELAAHLFGVVESLDVADDVRRTPLARARYEQDVAAVRARLGGDDRAIATAWAAGAGRPLGEALRDLGHSLVP
jgi:hypothetical protein